MKDVLKIIVAGSRSLDGDGAYRALCDAGRFFANRCSEVVSGCQRGMDQLGERWAENCAYVPVKRFPADWNAHGDAAGPIRNRAMAAYGDFAIVVWTGDLRRSPGSADMLDAMRLAGKPALSVIYRPSLAQVDLFK